MVKLRITPNGAVLESEIIITNETLVRLTNPENAKRIKAALSDFGVTSHRIEESDKNVSVMSCSIKDGETIEPMLMNLFKTHTEFIDWAQSLPVPTPTIDFKDDDEEEIDDNEEAMKSMVENIKQALNDDPQWCVMKLFIRNGVGELLLAENGIKALLNAFMEKYGEEEKSL